MFKIARNSALGLTLLALLMPAAQAEAKPQEVIASTVMMETHPVVANFVFPLFREWEKQANNSIKITYFNPGTICAAIDMYPSAEKGVVGITTAPLSAQPAMFPASTVANLPLMFINSRAVGLTLPEAIETIPQLKKEMANWRLIYAAGSVPTNLLTIKKQVRTLEDLKGMKIAVTSNDNMDIIKSLGGTPVNVQLNDMYMALQRGMVDGCLLPPPTFKSTKVTEVAKYLTMCNLQASPTPLVMSKATYEGLPAEAREVLERVGLRAMSAAGSNYPDYFGDVDTQWVVDNHKVQVYELPTEERARWIEAVSEVDDKWLERARRQGVEDPEGLLKQFRAIAAKYNDLETQKQILDGYREQLGGFFPADNVYKALWGE